MKYLTIDQIKQQLRLDDQSFLPAMNVRKVPLVGVAVSMMSALIDTSQVLAAATMAEPSYF